MALFYLPFGDTIQSGYACLSMQANEITSIHELLISSNELLFGRLDSRTGKNDTSNIASRLAKLPPQQFAIASDIINRLFCLFATTK